MELKKQPEKYILSVGNKISKTLLDALDDLSEWKGDIVQIKGTKYYRLKIHKYRFVFTYDSTIDIICVEEINTRTNINYREWFKK